MAPKNVAVVDLVDSHEERLLRVESKTAEISEDVVACRADIRHLQETTDRIDKKIDSLGATMEKHSVDSMNRFSLVLDRVNVLESDKVRTQRLIEAFKKVASWVLGGLGGAVLVKYGEAIFEFLVK